MKTVLKARIAIFMTLFCLAFTATAIAENNELKGVWSIESADYMDVKKTVWYKIFNENGTFTTLISNDEGKTFVIASRGEYEVETPNTYIEKFNEISTRILSTKTNTITFKKEGEKLNLTFKIRGKSYNEVWEKTSIPTIH